MSNPRITLRQPVPSTNRVEMAAGAPGLSRNAPAWNWRDGLTAVWQARRPVLLFVAIVTLAASVVNFIRPNEYTAKATLLPPRTQGRLSSLASLAPSILSMAGAALPSEMSGGSDLYPTIIKSESVIRPLLTSPLPAAGQSGQAAITLLDITETENPQIAVERVRDLLQTRIDRPTGACEVSVTLEDPVTAAAVCNAFVTALTERRIALHASGAAQVKEFVAGRLEQVREELAMAEETLEQFRAKNRNYSTGGSPELQTEDDRLSRQVLMKSQLYVQLSQEHEMARIEETRDVADIQILDTAAVPTLPSGPHRIRGTLSAGLSAGPLAIAVLLFWNYMVVAWGARLPSRVKSPAWWRKGTNQPITPIREFDDGV